MARPGKSIFDVTMMAGWAFAAVLTGLVALTMVDDTRDSAKDPSVVASLDNGDARLVTGSIDKNASSLDDKSHASTQNNLVAQQNQSFDPFAKQSGDNAHQLQDLMAELKSLKQEVSAFHTTTQRLRDENNRLKQRLAKLELDGPEVDAPVRVVELPQRVDSRNPFILGNGQVSMPVDTQSTGSIGRVGGLENGGAFDPFKQNDQPQLRITEEPLTLDYEAKAEPVGQMLPRDKPAGHGGHAAQAPQASVSDDLRAVSEVVSAPNFDPLSSQPTFGQTAFGLDLGTFVSISDINGAWREISETKKSLVGDLRPLSRVTQNTEGQLALHLVLGPISNAAQAASICAQLNYSNFECSVSAYRGQSLALK
ncbi:hypothetical protein [uncultured Cohaesibacter sp.]|uniref:hypothetical protein n=1 Tax=uncultured Cohaesibacter sp. TaxID=1002546 RepID=UPI0029C761F8|nr:hypothetical protein [uncultured Cohaesibacter sp.]